MDIEKCTLKVLRNKWAKGELEISFYLDELERRITTKDNKTVDGILEIITTGLNKNWPFDMICNTIKRKYRK